MAKIVLKDLVEELNKLVEQYNEYLFKTQDEKQINLHNEIESILRRIKAHLNQ